MVDFCTFKLAVFIYIIALIYEYAKQIIQYNQKCTYITPKNIAYSHLPLPPFPINFGLRSGLL